MAKFVEDRHVGEVWSLELDILDVRIVREFVQDRGTYPLQSDIRQSFLIDCIPIL
jgi:hypothetical protein